MRLVVTGSRRGRPDVYYWLDRWVRKYGIPELVILGDARGVDLSAKGWCIDRGYSFRVFKATWGVTFNDLGKDQGGTLRNIEMVNAARTGDWCVGFPTRESIGTYHCLRYAQKRGLFTFACPEYRAA